MKGGIPQAYDRNKSQYFDVAVNVLEQILTLMCPITYSPGNLRSLLERGKRTQNKTVLLKIIERNTGISGEDTIESSRRCDRMVAEDILAAYKDKGSRGKDLQLPSNYERDGPYEYDLVGAECVVKNKFENTKAIVIVPRLAELYIDLPWSESRAVLRQKNGNFRKSMAEIFNNASTPEPEIQTPAPLSSTQTRIPKPRHQKAKPPTCNVSPVPTQRPWENSPDALIEESQDIYDTVEFGGFEDDAGAIQFMEGYLSIDYRFEFIHCV